LIPRETVIRAMAQMDFLLNISNNTNFQLPSKSVDYMASGKPIINISSIKNDLFNQFFKDYPLIINLIIPSIDKSDDVVKNWILFLENFKGELLEADKIENFIKPFKLEKISSIYLETLKDSNSE
jgi:hypothetical protein